MKGGALARSDREQRNAARVHAGAMIRVTFAGEELDLHPAGAIFLPGREMLIVADLHLEKSAAFAARGQMLPPYETLETLRRLAGLVGELRPRQLVLLGDSFHSAIETIGEVGPAREVIEDLGRRSEIIWIAGNHDPVPPLRLPGHWIENIRLGELVLRHAPVDDGSCEIVGHLHPAARLATRAGSQRRRCFALAGRRLLMPAFGTLTGMVDLADPTIRRFVPETEARVFMLCRQGLIEMPLSACAR